MKNRFLFILLALLAVISSSCQQEDENDPVPTNCKLSEFVYDGTDKYEVIYTGSVITKFKQVSGTPLQDEFLFYNADSLLTHRYTYNNSTNKISDVDTFIYDSNKKLITHTWFDVNSSGVRSFISRAKFIYNISNQLISMRDSSYDGYSYVEVSDFTYTGNRITTETVSYFEDGDFFGKDVYTYTYSSTANSFYNIVPQTTVIFNNNPVFIAEFTNSDLLISQSEEKYYDESNTLIDTYTRIFSYTFENGQLASVGDNESGTFINFKYTCD